MTRSRVGWTLAGAVLLCGCHRDVACIADDPPELILTARSTADGALLAGLSGSVVSRDLTTDLVCFPDGEHDKCYGQARGAQAAVHLARDGFVSWDTAAIRLEYVGDDCPRPVTKTFEVPLTPEEGS